MYDAHDTIQRTHERLVRLTSTQVLLAIAAAVLVLDQATKTWIREALPLHASVTVIPGLLDLTHVRNTGAVFGLLNAADIPFKPALMTVIALLALVAIAIYAWRSAGDGPAARLALALILGGAVGNLVDRVRIGYVVDFVDVYWRGYHFWAFNVADAAISVGAVLLILDMIVRPRHASGTA